MTPLVFLLAHLALVVVFMVAAALSVRRARREPFQHNGHRYQRHTTPMLLRLLEQRDTDRR